MLTTVDWLIMILYFVLVFGMDISETHIRTSNDFFLGSRAIPAWVCGIAFMSANLGVQEVIGHGRFGSEISVG